MRLRGLRSDLIDPAIAAHHGRIVKRTGDGSIIEFRSVVEAVRCAIEVQTGMVERNAGVAPDEQIEFRVGIHLGDVVEEADGDLMGDGVNIAARLEGVCEPGSVCLSEDAYRQIRDKLNESFADLGEKALKNIARPVRVFALGAAAVSAPRGSAIPSSQRMLDEETIAHSRKGRPASRARTHIALAGLATVVLAAGVGGLWNWRQDKPVVRGAGSPSLTAEVATGHPSIVVMPLANLSGHQAQDYFADGLTEDIIASLGRFPDITVISRSAAFAYKGKLARPDEIGRELNVAYLVDGSVRKTGDRARVSVELLETARATVLWTERYDREIKNLFTIQEEIARQIAGTLSVRLTDTEYVDLGIAYLIAGQTDDAIATLGRAIQRYDDNALLHALLAGAYATVGRKADAAKEADIVKRMLPSFQAKDFATRLRDHPITPCARVSSRLSTASSSIAAVSDRTVRPAWPSFSSSKASTIPPAATRRWVISRQSNTKGNTMT